MPEKFTNKVEIDPDLKKLRDYNSKDLKTTHFGFGNNKNNYATEQNIHYIGKVVDQKGLKKVDARSGLRNQFDFGVPSLDNKNDFYKTTYNSEVSDKDQRDGNIGQPVT